MRAPDGEPGRELFSFSSLPWILCARGLIPPEEKRDALGDCADAVEDVGVGGRRATRWRGWSYAVTVV